MAAAPERAHILDRLEDRALQWQLAQVLPIPRGMHRPADRGAACSGIARAKQRRDERRLARPVRPHQRDHVGAHRGQCHVVQQHAIADGHTQLVGVQHAITAPVTDLEPQRHRVRLARRRREPGQAPQLGATALGLRAVHACEVTADVFLFLRDELLLLVELPLEREHALLALTHEGRVAASVGMRGAARDMQHMVHRLVQKGAIVTDHDHRLAQLAEVGLEPLRGLEIEMVRRLVEQQQLRRCSQLPCQSHSSAFTAAQADQHARTRLHGVEAKALQHLVDASGEVVTAFVHELLLQATVPVHQRLVAIPKLFGKDVQLLLDRDQWCIRGRRGLPHRRGVAEVAVLVQQ